MLALASSTENSGRAGRTVSETVVSSRKTHVDTLPPCPFKIKSQPSPSPTKFTQLECMDGLISLELDIFPQRMCLLHHTAWFSCFLTDYLFQIAHFYAFIFKQKTLRFPSPSVYSCALDAAVSLTLARERPLSLLNLSLCWGICQNVSLWAPASGTSR